MNEGESYTPKAVARIVAFCLACFLVVGFAYFYFSEPCWPWEEQVSIAGGTFCDGERKARFNID